MRIMRKIGFIGLGHMGGILLRSLLESGGVNQEEVMISTRTVSKLAPILEAFPKVTITGNNTEVARSCKYIFVGVKPKDVKGVIEEIKGCMVNDVHIVYMAAALRIESIEKIFSGRITRIMPSITCEVGEGAMLVRHNCKMSKEEAGFLNTLLSKVSMVKEVGEEEFAVGTDIVGCAPGFFAGMVAKFAEQAVKYGSFSPEEVSKILVSTLYGTAKLLHQKNLMPEELVKVVATKGGITEQGVEILNEGLPSVFKELFEVTIERHNKIEEEVAKQYKI